MIRYIDLDRVLEIWADACQGKHPFDTPNKREGARLACQQLIETSLTYKDGAARKRKRLTPEEVRKIRTFQQLSTRKVAKLFGVDQKTVWNIRAGKAHKR